MSIKRRRLDLSLSFDEQETCYANVQVSCCSSNDMIIKATIKAPVKAAVQATDKATVEASVKAAKQ